MLPHRGHRVNNAARCGWPPRSRCTFIGARVRDHAEILNSTGAVGRVAGVASLPRHASSAPIHRSTTEVRIRRGVVGRTPKGHTCAAAHRIPLWPDLLYGVRVHVLHVHGRGVRPTHANARGTTDIGAWFLMLGCWTARATSRTKEPSASAAAADIVAGVGGCVAVAPACAARVICRRRRGRRGHAASRCFWLVHGPASTAGRSHERGRGRGGEAANSSTAVLFGSELRCGRPHGRTLLAIADARGLDGWWLLRLRGPRRQRGARRRLRATARLSAWRGWRHTLPATLEEDAKVTCESASCNVSIAAPLLNRVSFRRRRRC